MNRFWNALIAIDIWVNVKVFRGQRETMSDRMGENLLEKDYGCCKWRVAVCKVLSWIDPRKGNHCIESIEIID
jgi:hypothetical protein